MLKRETIVVQRNHSNASGVKQHIKGNRERSLDSYWVTVFLKSAFKNGNQTSFAQGNNVLKTKRIFSSVDGKS